MPDIPEDIVRVSLTHAIDGVPETFVNNFHVRVASPDGPHPPWPEAVQEIANKVQEKYTAGGRPLTLLSNAIRLKRVAAYHLAATAGATPAEKVGRALHLGEWVGDVAGGAPGTLLPFDVCAVLTLEAKQAGVVLANPRTGPNASRQHRGRLSIGPLVVGNLEVNNAAATVGRMSAAARNAWLDAYDAFFEDVEGMTVGGGVNPAFCEVGILSKAGGAFHRLTSIRMDDLFDTQRRRSAQMVGQRASRTLDQA